MTTTTPTDTAEARAASGLGSLSPTTPVPRPVMPQSVEEYVMRFARPELIKASQGTGLQPDRLVRIAMTTVRRSHLHALKVNKPNQSLLNADPASFAGAFLTATALGFEVDLLGDCWLVPFDRQVQLLIGWQGYQRLYFQHPLAKGLDAGFHCRNDTEFIYRRGAHPMLEHVPLLDGDRGEIIGYYAVAALTTGWIHPERLTPEQVMEIRRGKVGTNDPKIPDALRWMEVKVAVRSCLKQVPRSLQMRIAEQADELEGAELTRQGVPQEAVLGAPAIEQGNGQLAYEPEPMADKPARPQPQVVDDVLQTTTLAQPPAAAAEQAAAKLTAAPEGDETRAEQRPRQKAKPSKVRTALFAALRDHFGDPAVTTAALHKIAGPDVHPDYVTDDELRKAAKLTAEEVAAWQEDQAMADIGHPRQTTDPGAE